MVSAGLLGFPFAPFGFHLFLFGSLDFFWLPLVPLYCGFPWASVARVGGTTFSFLCFFVGVPGNVPLCVSDVFVAPAVVLFAVFV